MASKSKLEDLNLSRDELKRLEDAFKDEKFREMFCEYAQEISDPENRRRYEEEIAQMEMERGMDVTFIHPEPGYVLKTSVDGDKKAFINISKSDKVDKPSSERKQNDDGKSGLMWHIPHSFAPPREDQDKEKNRCMVYDFVVHPDTYRMAESNARFQKLVEDTAMDGIEKQFQVRLDRKNLKRPKMQYKGTPSATVIRSRNTGGATPGPDASGLLKDMPYPYDNKTTVEKMKEREQNLSRKHEKNKGQSNEVKSKDDATTPKYTIIHRSEIDMQEYRNAPDAKPSTRPRELVINIELPLLKSAAEANLDIFEKRLCLESSPPAAYKLDLSLPYPVDDSKGSAKFDKQKRTLMVTLPVVPGDLPAVPSFISDETAGNESETNGISSASSLKESIPAEKPLIEVLSNGTDPSLEDAGTTQQEDSLKRENGLTDPDSVSNGADSVSNGDSGIHFSAAVSYSLLDFTFTQDTETVTFLLKVKNVTENSIKHVSPSSHEIDFVCTSRGDGGFPLHFRLFLRFAESCMIVPEHCTVDVADDNVVLILLKERGSRGLWDQFWAGLHSDHLEKHLFLTTSNLQQQMEELVESSTDMGQVPMPPAAAAAEEAPSCSLEVTTMNEKKLTIKICPPGKGRSKNRSGREEDGEDDEYDPPSSAEIEVVHSHPTSPGLHGILKQTISESSEEAGLDAADTPPHSSNEEDDLPLTPPASSPGKRRTVSFSEHIDKATFKASASVNSMKTALKSKRKRQRKFEEKKEKSNSSSSRRRHNSAGSEGSLSDSHPSEEEAVMGGEENSPEDHGEASADPACRVLDFRTRPDGPTSGDGSGCGDSNPNDSENPEVERNENLGDREEVEVFNQDGPSDDTKGSMADAQPGSAQGSSGEGSSGIGSSKKGGSIADRIKSKLAESTAEDPCEDSDDDEEGKAVPNGVTEGQDTSQPGQASGSAADKSYNEHRTECAFQFSNDVMFNLDVE